MNAAAKPEFDYVEQAGLTVPQQYAGKMVSFFHFKTVLVAAIDALHKLDAIKKTLFEGTDVGLPKPEFPNSCENMIRTKQDEHIMYAIIGNAAETSEQLSQLYAWFIGQVSSFDRNAMVQEIGDQQRYQAILGAILGFDFDEVQAVSVNKLRRRFKCEFDEYDKINRSLPHASAVLVSGVHGYRVDSNAAAVAQLQTIPGAFDPLPIPPTTIAPEFVARAGHWQNVAAGVAEASADSAQVAAECELSGNFSVSTERANAIDDSAEEHF